MRHIRLNHEYILNNSVEDVLSILRVANSSGKLRDIKPDTDNILVTCPCHSGGQETKPACNIYIGSDTEIPYGYFHCFVCGAKGGFLKFVMHCLDASEDFALSWLLKRFDAKHVPIALDLGSEINLTKKPKETIIFEASLLDKFLDWTPYLAQRKLSRNICTKFNVKYDPLYRQVIFPTYDLQGRLRLMPRRSIDTKTFYIDEDLEKPLYCLDQVIKQGYKYALVTEGPFDTLTGWEYGYPTCGTWGQPSEEQISQLNFSGLTTLYLAFDNDEAGKRFNRTLRRTLGSHILLVDVQLPTGKKDLNDLTKEEFDLMMQQAFNSSLSTSYNIKVTNAAQKLHDKIKKYKL